MKKILKNVTICSMLFLVCSVLCCAGTAEGKAIQSASQAQAAALKEVPSAKVIEVDTDMENGQLVYEVELYKGGKEYNLHYRASDGKLVKYEWEIKNPPYTDQNKRNLSKQTIHKKALGQVKHATIVSTTLKYDDGREEYKVRLKKGNKKYKLVYDSKSGKLLDYEWELTDTGSTSSSKYIGAAKAKSIALKKVPGATVIKVEFDHDDGIAVYEVEMVKGRYEYEVKIDAKTGKILEFEKDIDD